MRFNLTARRVYLAPALGIVLVTAMSACSSSSSSSSSAASPPPSAPASSSAAASSSPAASGGSATATSEITANWNTFFNSATPNSKREQLLQNGSQFASSLTAFASSPLAAAVTSKVDSVKLTSATAATVKYDLSALGTTVASGATGSSVLQDGTWKVGDDVFCGLLSQAKSAGLSIPVPSTCSSAS
jgi:hypothetical protein